MAQQEINTVNLSSTIALLSVNLWQTTDYCEDECMYLYVQSGLSEMQAMGRLQSERLGCDKYLKSELIEQGVDEWEITKAIDRFNSKRDHTGWRKRKPAMEARDKLGAISIGRVLKKDIKPPVDLFGGIIHNNTATMIHGATGVGKTQFVVALAVSVACGGSFAGWAASEPKRVLYVDGEMTEYGFRSIFEHMENSVTGIDRGALHDNFVLVSQDNLETPLPRIDDPVANRQYITYVEAGFDLVVFDNVRVLTQMNDENSSESWGHVNTFLTELRKHCAVIVVHHDNRRGAYSGSSNALTVLNKEIKLSLAEPTTAMSGCGACFKVEFGKCRELRSKSMEPRKLGLHPEGGWVVEHSNEMLAYAKYKEAYDILMSGDVATKTELASALEISRPTLNKWIPYIETEFDIGVPEKLREERQRKLSGERSLQDMIDKIDPNKEF